MKVFAQICVPEPKNAIKVIETLINASYSVVIRGSAYDRCNPTIFLVGYGEVDIEDTDYEVIDHFESLLGETGGDVTDAGEGHEATLDELAPPAGLQLAIDILDNQSGIAHRIGCREYSPERALKMAIAAVALLTSADDKSVGNALARRLLRAAPPSAAA